jgi:hypothetical protein
MRKRRPSRRGSSARADEQAAAVGVAWYSPAEFVPLRECAADLDIIEDTHAEWEDKAIEVLQVLARKGVMAERIPLIVDEVVRWCAERAGRAECEPGRVCRVSRRVAELCAVVGAGRQPRLRGPQRGCWMRFGRTRSTGAGACGRSRTSLFANSRTREDQRE